MLGWSNRTEGTRGDFSSSLLFSRLHSSTAISESIPSSANRVAASGGLARPSS